MKFGICNEIFKDWNDTDRTIGYVRSIGYEGLEIAPFTLAASVKEVSDSTRRAIAQRAEQEGLEIIGLHWLLAGVEGLHLTHPDAGVRERTGAYLCDLARFCGDVGGRLMVFGSPQQRNLLDGVDKDEAFDYARAVFESALPVCEACGVTLCMEQLSRLETDFCNTVEDTVRLVEAVAHPNFQLMLDTKAMIYEDTSRADLIRQHAKRMRHYHANDENLGGPGSGEVDFAPIFEALREIAYTGYVSVEVFDFVPGPEMIAEKSLAYMKQFV